MDQAQSLRDYMHRMNDSQPPKPASRVITITSGKGGVGKSNFTINFALGLKKAGKKVVVLDLDLSTANINILMGLTPRYRLIDILYKQIDIWDVIEKGTEGIEYISGGLEIDDLMKLDESTLAFFWAQIQQLQNYADFILLDTGAGVSKELIDFILASDETIIVTTPEPPAIADSYAVMKTVLNFTEQPPIFRLVVNRAQSYREAVETAKALQNACSSFLKMKLTSLGCLMEDTHVRQAVRQQMPFLLLHPNCHASRNIKQIVSSFLPGIQDNPVPERPAKGLRGFFEKMLLGKSS